MIKDRRLHVSVAEFKDGYTLSEYAAFAMAANWAKNCITAFEEERAITHHLAFFYRGNIPEVAKNIVRGMRDFFSHTTMSAKPLQELLRSEEAQKVRRFLYSEARFQLADQELDSEALSANPPQPSDPLSKKKIELALWLAPFLKRSQAAFLADQIRGLGKTADACKTALRAFAQPDRALILPSEAPWMSNKQLHGLALVNRLSQHLTKASEGEPDDSFPLDAWFFRQLVLYAENHSLLKSVRLERTCIQEDENGALVQSKTFDEKEAEGGDINPLRIKHNTIAIECRTDEGRKQSVLGMQPLKYLVLASLDGHPAEKIDRFVRQWHQQPRSTRKRAGKRPNLDKSLPNRIQFLRQKHGAPKNLHQRIVFIADIVNRAFLRTQDRSFSAAEYRECQQEARHYSKQAFRSWLKERELLDADGLDLGSEDELTLRSLLNQDDLYKQYDALYQAYCQWLSMVESRLPQLTTEEKEQLGKRLGVRNPQTTGAPPATAIDADSVRYAFFSSSNQQHFFNLTRSVAGQGQIDMSPFGLEQSGRTREWPGSVRKGMRLKEQWAKCQMLYLMFRESLKRHRMGLKLGPALTSKELAPRKIRISLPVGNGINIQCSAQQQHRAYAHLSKGQMRQIVECYVWKKGDKDSQAKQIPLLANQGSGSIEAAQKEINRQRFLLVRALLRWEQNFLADRMEWVASQQKEQNYVAFNVIAKKAGLSEQMCKDLGEYRNSAFHDSVPKFRYDNVCEPVRQHYLQLLQQDGSRRQKQKKRGQKTGLSSRKWK